MGERAEGVVDGDLVAPGPVDPRLSVVGAPELVEP